MGVKLGVILGVLVYGGFALLMSRQVDLMAKTFETSHEGLIRLLTYIHLGIVLLMLVIAVVML